MAGKFIKTCFLLGGLCLALTSCKGSGSSELSGEVDLCLSANDCGSTEIYFAPSIMKAQSQDISFNRAECSGKDSDKVCVLICHRPPGNPDNAKTKVLPLQAVFAHLNHGNPTQPDTIGTCDDPIAEEPPAEDGGDTGEEPGDGDEGEEPGDGDDGEEIPVWCEENLDIDSDCDGIGDGPGVPPTPIY